MNSFKSFSVSLILHLLILLPAWGVFKILRTVPEPETKIRVALVIQSPTAAQSTPVHTIPPQSAAPIRPSIKIPEANIPKQIKPPQTTPFLSAPTEIKPIAAVNAVNIPQAEPVAAVTPSIEPVTKAPPPPPAVNIQAQYEEENLGRIRTLLLERLKYPKNALRLRQQGDIVVTFTLSPSGDISTLSVTKSSEFELLDEAARTLIMTTASAFPKPSKNVRITVPIDYKIR